jgi:formate hydrogenlyase subunit 3/multisubunit Na+/H+ antiporter MnhD subunit
MSKDDIGAFAVILSCLVLLFISFYSIAATERSKERYEQLLQNQRSNNDTGPN